MPVAIPEGAHDAAGKVELDVIHAVEHLLSDGAHKTAGAIALFGKARGERVSGRGREEIATGKDPWPDELSSVIGPFQGHVDKVRHPRRADARDPGLRQALGGVGGILYGQFRQRGIGQTRPFEMHVHIPQPRQQIGALQVDDLRPLRRR